MTRASLLILLTGSAVLALVGFQARNQLNARFSATTPDHSYNQRDVLCGPRSLHIAMSLLSIPATPEELVKDCAVGQQGVTFRELAAVAQKYSLKDELNRLSWNELLESAAVTVLFVDRNHFVVADARQQSDQVKVYDGALPSRMMDQIALEKPWSGEALILFRGSTSPLIEAESLWNDAGFTDQDRQDFHVALTNRSASAVALRIAGTSCSCTSSRLSSDLIQPGATEYLGLLPVF